MILVGLFGALARAPLFAHPRYCARAVAGATMVVMVTRPMNTKIMRRRVVDPPLFHLANDRQSIVSCGILVGSTCLPFLRPRSPRLGLLWSMATSSRQCSLFALALMRCDVPSDMMSALDSWPCNNGLSGTQTLTGKRANRRGAQTYQCQGMKRMILGLPPRALVCIVMWFTRCDARL